MVPSPWNERRGSTGRTRVTVPAALSERPGECPPQHDWKAFIEFVSCMLGKVVALTRPCERMREGADAHGQRERVGEAPAPRLQVGVAQPAEPRVARPQPGDLLQE